MLRPAQKQKVIKEYSWFSKSALLKSSVLSKAHPAPEHCMSRTLVYSFCSSTTSINMIPRTPQGILHPPEMLPLFPQREYPSGHWLPTLPAPSVKFCWFTSPLWPSLTHLMPRCLECYRSQSPCSPSLKVHTCSRVGHTSCDILWALSTFLPRDHFFQVLSQLHFGICDFNLKTLGWDHTCHGD